MDGFSDIENSSSDVGTEVNEVETPDADFCDGDGVNDFDDTYESMNSGEETMEYSQETSENPEPVENNNEDTDTAVDEQLNDFVDIDESAGSTETSDVAPAGDNVEPNPSDMTTDENVDDALSDFEEEDDETSEADTETTADETGELDTEVATDESGESETEATTDESGEPNADIEATVEETGEADTDDAVEETGEADTDENVEETDATDTEETGETGTDDTADETQNETRDSMGDVVSNSDSRNYKSSNPEVADGVRDIVNSSFAEARDISVIANEGENNGRFFTDHKSEHVEMVAEKSLEAGDAIVNAIDNGGLKGENTEERISFSKDIDKMTLEGAGLSHDTGMRGDGYRVFKNESGEYQAEKYNNNNFDDIRKNHSLNSAINMLSNREKYIDAGYSSDQVDKMAAECMAHSKSSSGVRDLNDRSQWSDCFDRIDAAVEVYNKEHENKISFDRSLFEENDSNLSSLASETFALRVGDASRDSHPEAIAQSDEKVYTDTSLLEKGESWKDEIANPNSVTIGEDREAMDSDFSRRVHAGEQNICENHTFADEQGGIIHEITVIDGSVAPMCTQAAIEDHIGELMTAKDADCSISVKFDSPCDNDAKMKYDTLARNMFNEYGIDVVYPWD